MLAIPDWRAIAYLWSIAATTDPADPASVTDATPHDFQRAELEHKVSRMTLGSLLDELLEEEAVVVEDADLERGVAGEGVGGAAEAGVVGAEGHLDLVE
jgi:hypothetical protein